MILEPFKRTYPLVVKINGEYYTHPYFMDDKQNIAGFEYPGTLLSVKIKLETFIISMISFNFDPSFDHKSDQFLLILSP